MSYGTSAYTLDELMIIAGARTFRQRRRYSNTMSGGDSGCCFR